MKQWSLESMDIFYVFTLTTIFIQYQYYLNEQYLISYKEH